MDGDRYEIGKDLAPISRSERRKLGELARKAGIEDFSGKSYEIKRIFDYNQDFEKDEKKRTQLSRELTNLLYATRSAEEQIREMREQGFSEQADRFGGGVYGFKTKEGQRETFSFGEKKVERGAGESGAGRAEAKPVEASGERPEEVKPVEAPEVKPEEAKPAGEEIDDWLVDLDGVDDYDDSNFYGEDEEASGAEEEPEAASERRRVRGIQPAERPAVFDDEGRLRWSETGEETGRSEEAGEAGTGIGGEALGTESDSGEEFETEAEGEEEESLLGSGEREGEYNPGDRARETLKRKGKSRERFKWTRKRIIAIVAAAAIAVGGGIFGISKLAKRNEKQDAGITFPPAGGAAVETLATPAPEATMTGDYDDIGTFDFERDVPEDELADGSELEDFFGIRPDRVYQREKDSTRDNKNKQGQNRYNLATPIKGETYEERAEDLTDKIEDSYDLAVLYGSVAGYGDLAQMRVSDMRDESVRLEKAGRDSMRYDVAETWEGIMKSGKVTEFSPTDGTFYSENYTYNGSKDPNNIKRSRRDVKNTVAEKGAKYEGRYFDITDALSEEQQFNILYMLGLEGQAGNVEREGARFVIRENCAQIGVYVGEKQVAEARYEEPTDEWVVTTTPTPEPETTPTPEPETTPTPEPETTPTPEPETTPTPEPEVTLTPEPEVTPTPEPEVTPTPEPEVTPTPEPETTPTPEPEVTPTPEPEVTPTPEPEVTPTPEPEVTPTPEPETTPTPEPETTPTPEPEVTPTPEPKATKEPENLERIVEQAPTEGEVTPAEPVSQEELTTPPAPQTTIAPEQTVPAGANEEVTRENEGVPTSTQGTGEEERAAQQGANEEAQRQEERAQTETPEERTERENEEADDFMRRAAERAARRQAEQAAQQAAAQQAQAAAFEGAANESSEEGGEQ